LMYKENLILDVELYFPMERLRKSEILVIYAWKSRESSRLIDVT